MKKEQVKKCIYILLSGVLIGFIYGIFEKVTGFSLANFTSILPMLFSNLIFVVTLIYMVILGKFIYIRNKIKQDNYSDDENSVYSKQEKNLTLTLSISSMLIPTNLILTLNEMPGLKALNEMQNLISFIFISINMILGAYLEIAHINMLKKIEPTRYSDPLSTNYNEQTLELSDERDLQIKGKAALKTMNTMIKVYITIIVIGLWSNVDFSFFIAVWLIYIIESSIMLYNTLKCSDFKETPHNYSS